jgi:hypothetical protein
LATKEKSSHSPLKCWFMKQFESIVKVIGGCIKHSSSFFVRSMCSTRACSRIKPRKPKREGQRTGISNMSLRTFKRFRGAAWRQITYSRKSTFQEKYKVKKSSWRLFV